MTNRIELHVDAGTSGDERYALREIERLISSLDRPGIKTSIKSISHDGSCSRQANRGSFSEKNEVSESSSIYPGVSYRRDELPRIDAIAIVELLGSGSSVQLDTSNPHVIVTDVETAMRHVGVLSPGRYVAARDRSGHVLLQEQAGEVLPRLSAENRKAREQQCRAAD